MPFNKGSLGEDSDRNREAEEEEKRGPQPEFLPMVPWYSGTSADLLKTALDLAITLKLFVGRFDMRTMQVGIRSTAVVFIKL